MSTATDSQQQAGANEPAVRPEYGFRIGTVSMSVFANTITGDNDQSRVVHSIVLQRRYFDRKAGEWKTAKNLGGLPEVSNCIRLLEKARDYLESKEGEGGMPF